MLHNRRLFISTFGTCRESLVSQKQFISQFPKQTKMYFCHCIISSLSLSFSFTGTTVTRSYIPISPWFPHTPTILHPTAFWQGVKLYGSILREAVNSLPLHDESLGSECWRADTADNLMENFQKWSYPMCAAVDKRGRSGEYMGPTSDCWFTSLHC